MSVPAAYAVVAAVWIVVSDSVLLSLSRSVYDQAAGALVKGIAFVVVTAWLLHRALRWALVREREAMSALREENERKSKFIAMLSHELRNPLAPVRHALWLLDHCPPGSASAHHARETIGRQILHLTRLTDDLLDVTRIGNGKIVLKKARLDLVALVRQSIQDHEGVFAARDVVLSADLAETPLWLEADPIRIAQVVGNVLWNAAKFTDPGGRARVAVQRGAAGSATVRVTDNGIGIPAPVLAHVFKPFVQGDETLDRRRGGLGLGLSLAKELIELHGGTIDARSGGPGRGTEISMRLPLAPEQPSLQSAPRAATRTMPHRRVLVVEDNLDAAETLQEILLLWGHEVDVAHDGREAIDRAHAFHPDVVLCDIGLPVMDGYDVARTIRAHPELSSAFLVAVSGYASPEDARRAVDAGFDRHLGKPVAVETIEDVLATVPHPATALH